MPSGELISKKKSKLKNLIKNQKQQKAIDKPSDLSLDSEASSITQEISAKITPSTHSKNNKVKNNITTTISTTSTENPQSSSSPSPSFTQRETSNHGKPSNEFSHEKLSTKTSLNNDSDDDSDNGNQDYDNDSVAVSSSGLELSPASSPKKQKKKKSTVKEQSKKKITNNGGDSSNATVDDSQDEESDDSEHDTTLSSPSSQPTTPRGNTLKRAALSQMYVHDSEDEDNNQASAPSQNNSRKKSNKNSDSDSDDDSNPSKKGSKRAAKSFNLGKYDDSDDNELQQQYKEKSSLSLKEKNVKEWKRLTIINYNEGDKNAIPDVENMKKVGIEILKRKRNKETLNKIFSSSCIPEDVNSGKYTNQEKEILDKAVAKFLKDWDIPKSEIHHLLKRETPSSNPYYDASREFYDIIILQSGIKRNKRQLYWYFLRRFNAYKGQGKWTPEEDRWLIELVYLKGNKWKEIEKDIGRSNCRERHRRLRVLNDFGYGGWTAEEELRLIKAVRSRFEAGAFDVRISPTNWDAIAKKVKTRVWCQCMSRWYNLTRFTVNTNTMKLPSWSRSDHLNLLKRMSMFNAEDESGIDFSEIARSTLHESWNRGHSYDQLRLEWAKLRRNIPNIENMTFKETLKWATDNYDKLVPHPNILESDAESIEQSDDEDDENISEEAQPSAQEEPLKKKLKAMKTSKVSSSKGSVAKKINVSKPPQVMTPADTPEPEGHEDQDDDIVDEDSFIHLYPDVPRDNPISESEDELVF